MPSAQKVEKVAEIRERIQGSEAILLTEYRGLSVHDATELRRSLQDQARFAIVKNTLLKLAAGEAGMAELEPLLQGPTAVAFVSGDVVTAAKRVVDAAKRFPSLVIKGGWMEGRMLSGDQARALAELETREVMLSRMAGLLKAEMSRAASLFQTLQSRFLGVLEAYKDKLPAEAPEEAPTEPSAGPSEGEADSGAASAAGGPPEAVEAEASTETPAEDGPTEADAATEGDSSTGGEE
jgi:large subunit ribosomal protein L10